MMHTKNLPLPQFLNINLSTFPITLDALLKENLKQIDSIVKDNPHDWSHLITPLEDLNDVIEKYWSPMSHCHAVINSPARRECYQACLPKLSAYEAAVGQNSALYQAIKAIPQDSLDSTQQKIIADHCQDFELSGVALPADKKKRFESIQARLSELSNQFDNHLLDATQAFTLTITDEKSLQGLPAHALETAKALATEKNIHGWILTLEMPCYLAVMTYADDRHLRETIYQAYVTRASDQGPQAEQFDNTNVINEILSLRQEKAQLLGFANYAELSIATKMAESTNDVIHFLTDLLEKSRFQAEKEFQALKDYAATMHDLTDLKPWDMAYYSDKMCQAHYALSQEALRPYFPENTLMEGLFTVVKRLYGIQLTLMSDVEVWHPDVKCYQIIDEQKQCRGLLYVDLFARPNKRGGAWMDSLQGRRRLKGNLIQIPIATLTCNFAKPQANKMATFTHDDVLTLFHELGHCLHHLLTQVDYLSASGINAVEWDAVELPSQFFENFCWEKDVLQLITRHVETGESLPDALYDKLIASKNFQSAMGMLRQLEFSLFDFTLHQKYTGEPNQVANILSGIRKKTALLPAMPYNRSQHSFAHIFAGGYAAGYYSYKWAEVLSSDAFARFEEEGIFNPTTGHDFLHCILEVGGSKKAQDAFIAFRGRKPQIDALLRHSGIIS